MTVRGVSRKKITFNGLGLGAPPPSPKPLSSNQHKIQPFTRISPTQESTLHKNQYGRAGFKKKWVAPQAPPANGASSVKPGDTGGQTTVERGSTVRTLTPPPQPYTKHGLGKGGGGSEPDPPPSQTVFHGPLPPHSSNRRLCQNRCS